MHSRKKHFEDEEEVPERRQRNHRHKTESSLVSKIFSAGATIGAIGLGAYFFGKAYSIANEKPILATTTKECVQLLEEIKK